MTAQLPVVEPTAESCPVPDVYLCQHCDRPFDPIAHRWLCPHCKAKNTCCE